MIIEFEADIKDLKVPCYDFYFQQIVWDTSY